MKITYNFPNTQSGILRQGQGSTIIIVADHKADIDPENAAMVKLAEDKGGKPENKGKPRKKRGK